MKKRKKNIGSYQLAYCFTGEDLRHYRTERMDPQQRARIFHHLNVEKCARCRQLYRTIDLNPPAESFGRSGLSSPAKALLTKLRQQAAAQRPATIHPLHLETGQLWTTHCRPKLSDGAYAAEVRMSRPVIIVASGNRRKHLNNVIRVLPLSNDTDFQWRHDSVRLDQNPLGYPLLAEIFNEQPMLAGNLRRFVGNIDASDLARIQQVRRQFADQSETETPDEDYLQWQRIELEAVAYLAAPVDHALSEATAAPKVMTVQLKRYDKAADSAGIRATDVLFRKQILSAAHFELTLQQIRDQVPLRLVYSGDRPPQTVWIDGCERQLNPIGPDLYEYILGNANQLNETIEIQMDIDNRIVIAYMRFSPFE